MIDIKTFYHYYNLDKDYDYFSCKLLKEYV